MPRTKFTKTPTTGTNSNVTHPEIQRTKRPFPKFITTICRCSAFKLMMASAYSQEQLNQFYTHIDFPQVLREQPEPSLRVLEALHQHTLSTLPYENLSLHYNADHRISLDPQHLFQKMITDKRGRGGFCMEVAILYNHMLRAIGFDAYTAGVRTRGRLEGVPQGDYPGWLIYRFNCNFWSTNKRSGTTSSIL